MWFCWMNDSENYSQRYPFHYIAYKLEKENNIKSINVEFLAIILLMTYNLEIGNSIESMSVGIKAITGLH